MGLEEKVIAYRELAERINEMEAEKKLLSQEILMLMPQDEEVVQVRHLKVKCYHRINIKTTLEQAKEFHATKMEEIVDKEALKELLHQGILVPGVSESSYVIVSKLTKEKEPISQDSDW
jgi:hypothetical protein